VQYNGAKPQNYIVEKFCTTGGQSLLSLQGTSKKNFTFNFKRNYLTIHAINFFETFCTCSSSSLGQDPIVEIPKKNYFFSFLLLELEMADLSIFLEKNDLRPLRVKCMFMDLRFEPCVLKLIWK
jgi:hypothetical protein